MLPSKVEQTTGKIRRAAHAHEGAARIAAPSHSGAHQMALEESQRISQRWNYGFKFSLCRPEEAAAGGRHYRRHGLHLHRPLPGRPKPTEGRPLQGAPRRSQRK